MGMIFTGVFSTLANDGLKRQKKMNTKRTKRNILPGYWYRFETECSVENNSIGRWFNSDHLAIFSEFMLKRRNITLRIRSSRFG